MLVRELIKKFKEEWLPVDSLLQLDKKTEVTRAMLEALGDPELLLAWDSMPLWRVRGLGPKKAMALWVQGVRPGNLKRHLSKLPEATQIALEYPLMERIPRRLCEQAFSMWLPPGTKSRCTLVGSYRRGRPDSGDLDVLYRAKSSDDEAVKKEFDAFLDRLQAHLGAKWRVMARGAHKISGILSLTPKAAIEVDIWVATPANWAAMLLYATGSKEHNVRMRFIAKHRGFLLNQYGVFDEKGKLIPAKNEREIFDLLKIKWRRPEDR